MRIMQCAKPFRTNKREEVFSLPELLPALPPPACPGPEDPSKGRCQRSPEENRGAQPPRPHPAGGLPSTWGSSVAVCWGLEGVSDRPPKHRESPEGPGTFPQG